MTLIVEDGSGLANAESYISVADTDDYNTKYVGNAGWTAETDVAVKEAALRRATQWLDNEYGNKWKGRRINEAMSLDWPRYEVYDRDGYYIDSDAVPNGVREATAEMAIKIHGGEDPMPDQTDPGTIKSEMVRVGPITEDIEYMGGKSQSTWFKKIDALLQQLIISGTDLIRG